jgi:hypothetical protein
MQWVGIQNIYQLWRIFLDRIYIPTLGRYDNQITYNHLPQKWKDITTMVIQKKEEHLYDYDCEYLVVDNDIGIAKTREIIYRHGGKCRYIMIDDDITFTRRNIKYYGFESNMEMSKRNFIDSDYDDMISEFEEKHDTGVVVCGCRLSGMPPYPKRYTDTSGGVMNAYSIDGEIFSEFIDDIDFSYTKDSTFTVEDILINMEILSRGYQIGRFDEYLYCTDFGSVGGCSNFREDDFVKKGLEMIMEKFPTYIEILDEEMKNGQPRAKYAWSKLLKDSPNDKNKASLEEFFG